MFKIPRDKNPFFVVLGWSARITTSCLDAQGHTLGRFGPQIFCSVVEDLTFLPCKPRNLIGHPRLLQLIIVRSRDQNSSRSRHILIPRILTSKSLKLRSNLYGISYRQLIDQILCSLWFPTWYKPENRKVHWERWSSTAIEESSKPTGQPLMSEFAAILHLVFSPLLVV